MREKITKNRNTILMVLAILILSTLYIGMKYLMRPKYEPLPVVKLKDKETNKKKFAVMVQNGDSYEEYTNEDGTWPSEDDYEFKEAKCIDNNGSLVQNAVTFANGKVTLKTNKTIYCTLYFDKNLSVIATLRKNDPQQTLSSEPVGGMYRYQGVATVEQEDETHKVVDNNYICFGTDNKEDCTNESTGYDKYMYRIIGITEDGQLYLIKMKGVETDSNKTFLWTYMGDSPEREWPQSAIYTKLNGTKDTNGNNPIFINNSRYEYMVEGNDWYNKIDEHNWMYGDVSYDSNITLDGETVYGASNNGLILYDIETGLKLTKKYDNSQKKYIKHKWSNDKSVPAKIGLMYLHDYYLAYDNNRNWYTDYDTSNWIHFVNNKNTTGASTEILFTIRDRYLGQHSPPCDVPNPEVPSISRDDNLSNNFKNVDSLELGLDYGISSAVTPTASNDTYKYIPWLIESGGNMRSWDEDGYCGGTSGIARPTFYLSSTVIIKDGTGKIEDPYILNVQE